MSFDGIDILHRAAQILHDKKGMNILALEVGEFSSVTNYLLIAEGMVDRHVAAMARTVVKELREEMKVRPAHVEGMNFADWVLVDYINVTIHIFKPGLRDIYNLEKLWSDGKIISLEFSDQKTSSVQL